MKSIKFDELKSITDLYTEKIEEILSLIKKLQIDDVKDDTKFNLLVEKLKQDYRIKPVIINQTPKPISHKEVERATPANDPFYRGTPIKLLEVVLHYDYTGSKELFLHRDGSPISHFNNSQHLIIQPENDYLPVVVELYTLNKEEAIQKANNIMELTFLIVSNNSKIVEAWNNNLDSLIDVHITNKRDELIRFYL